MNSLRPARLVLQLACVSALALALAACSRSNVDSLAGPGREIAHDRRAGIELPPPVLVAPTATPCASLTGLGGSVAGTSNVVQFRATRLRIETVGDVTGGTLQAMSSCALGTVPSITIVSGKGTISKGGFNLAFGAMTPAVGEAGALLATDAAGNVLELIWPTIATPTKPGPPIVRLQVVNTSAFSTGDVIRATMQLTARAANGATATFNVSTTGMVVPAIK